MIAGTIHGTMATAGIAPGITVGGIPRGITADGMIPGITVVGMIRGITAVVITVVIIMDSMTDITAASPIIVGGGVRDFIEEVLPTITPPWRIWEDPHPGAAAVVPFQREAAAAMQCRKETVL